MLEMLVPFQSFIKQFQDERIHQDQILQAEHQIFQSIFEVDAQTLTKLAGHNNDGYCSIKRLMQYSKKPSCNHEILMRLLSLIMLALMLDEDNKIIKNTLDDLVSIV